MPRYSRPVPVSTGQRLLRFDRRLDARFVAGADEAGRGSLAFAAGVLPKKMHRLGPSGQYAISPTLTSRVGAVFFIVTGTSK